jgi:alpha-tubulin suppressor-like RCC1 family protein
LRFKNLVASRLARMRALLLVPVTMAVLTLGVETAPADAHSPYVAYAWGGDLAGQLGDDLEFGPDECLVVGQDLPCSTTPVGVVGAHGLGLLEGVSQVAGGEEFELGLLEDGDVVAWGDNESGQLGVGAVGEEEGSAVPVPLSFREPVEAVAAGGEHGAALEADGHVKTWGNGELGQLGNETEGSSDVPVPVKPVTPGTSRELAGVKSIAAGVDDDVAALGSGKVVAWGAGESGQLGDGKLENKAKPVAVKDISDGTMVAAGEEDVVALLGNGTVVAWGENEFGELGDGTFDGPETCGPEKTPCSRTPVEVQGLTEVVAVVAGAHYNLALLGNGTVEAWGDNGVGQLGDGMTRNSDTPVAVKNLAGVAAIAASGNHSLALLDDGEVVAWGENASGELGDETSEGPELCSAPAVPCSTGPVLVDGLEDVSGIGAGSEDSVAFGQTAEPMFTRR